MSRVLKDAKNQITWGYIEGTHGGIDLVKDYKQLAYIIAHSDGEVVEVRTTINSVLKGTKSYGNYVKIKHNNGMYTLYAHMKYGSIKVKKGDKVIQGQVIGYMGNTGDTNGSHLHFEVRDKYDIRINPTQYIDSDLPTDCIVIEVGTKPVTEELVKAVCQGKYGNYPERKTRLENEGYNYSEVQKIVNQRKGVYY